jgi:large subunit ribosomal protein L34
MGFNNAKEHRKSRIKRKRQCGFLSRMATKGGRAMINRRRRIGRKLPNVA